MASLTDIFSWFQTGDLPTEAQFKATFQSFFHKDEKIPTSAIQGFDTLFNNTATTEQVNKMARRDASNLTDADKTSWKTALNVGALPPNLATYDPAQVNYVMMKDGTTQFAGDLGKNVGNSAITSVAGAGLTLGANWTLNANNYALNITGLADKSNDATFNRMAIMDAGGKVAVADSTSVLLKGIANMSDSQKDAFRVASRKTNESYSLGQPRIDMINPPIIDGSKDFVQYLSVIGQNLFMNISDPSQTVVTLKRVKDAQGNQLQVADTWSISNIQVFQNNFQLFNFSINFKTYPTGYYQIFATHNGLTNLKSPEFLVANNVNLMPTNLTDIQVVDKFPNPEDIVNTDQIYHIQKQNAGANILEKSVKIKDLLTYETGFYVEFEVVWNVHGRLEFPAFSLGIGKTDADITNGFNPTINFGIPSEYYGKYIRIATTTTTTTIDDTTTTTTYTDLMIKFIVINKNGITTVTISHPSGVALTNSFAQIFNPGDKLHLYYNYYSSDQSYGDINSVLKLLNPKNYIKI